MNAITPILNENSGFFSRFADHVVSCFSTFTFLDALDIVLLGFFFFFAFSFI